MRMRECERETEWEFGFMVANVCVNVYIYIKKNRKEASSQQTSRPADQTAVTSTCNPRTKNKTTPTTRTQSHDSF